MSYPFQFYVLCYNVNKHRHQHDAKCGKMIYMRHKYIHACSHPYAKEIWRGVEAAQIITTTKTKMLFSKRSKVMLSQSLMRELENG